MVDSVKQGSHWCTYVSMLWAGDQHFFFQNSMSSHIQNELLKKTDFYVSVSDELLQKNLKAMEKSLKQLELDIKNMSKSQTEVDRFSDVMNEFIASAKGQYEVMKGMYKMVDNLYKEMGKFYTFDIKKYTMEDFFNDIKTFKELFVVRTIFIQDWYYILLLQ